MEFVIVEFPESRGVLIDGTPCGDTNTTLMVEVGNHEFTLDGEKDFDPESIETLVQHTTADDPLVIKCSKRASALGGREARTPLPDNGTGD